MNDQLLVSRKEAAKALSISLRKLDAMISSQEIPSRRIGRRRLVPVASLRQFAKQGPISREGPAYGGSGITQEANGVKTMEKVMEMRHRSPKPATTVEVDELRILGLSTEEVGDPPEQMGPPRKATPANKTRPTTIIPSVVSSTPLSAVVLRPDNKPNPVRAIVIPGEKTSTNRPFLSAEEWLTRSLDVEESEIVFGSPEQAIVRPLTKNLIEAAEKVFKTTFWLRAMLGLSCGTTLFPKLPVIRARKVLYVHGELSPPEIQERTRAGIQGLSRPLTNFIQGRDLRINLIEARGQNVLRDLVREMQPDDLVLDPLQGFIFGFDENEFRDVSRATHFMDDLIEEFGVTIYLVTHTGKDHSRGTRGHSSLAGWRDTLFKLDRKKNNVVEVKIDPRWASPLEFNIEFKDGTMWPTERSAFTPQETKIRKFLETQDGRATKDKIGEHLGLEGDTLRKAFERAGDDDAIVIDGDLVSLPGMPELNAVDLLTKG